MPPGYSFLPPGTVLPQGTKLLPGTLLPPHHPATPQLPPGWNRVTELEAVVKRMNDESEKQNLLMEQMEQVNASLKNRVTELEVMVNRMNDESEKQKQLLEQVNDAVLRAKDNNLAEEISSLSIDISVTQDNKEKELIAQVYVMIFVEIAKYYFTRRSNSW
jgi:hypothetical protein